MTILTEIDLVNNKMMTMADITRFTTLSDKWFYKLIQDGRFPKPVKFGRKSLWLQSEVIEWVNECIVESRDK